MTIKLSDHFTYGRILRFTLPSIAMMIFSSIYGVVDGFFVSNFVGKTPFAAAPSARKGSFFLLREKIIVIFLKIFENPMDFSLIL